MESLHSRGLRSRSGARWLSERVAPRQERKPPRLAGGRQAVEENGSAKSARSTLDPIEARPWRSEWIVLPDGRWIRPSPMGLAASAGRGEPEEPLDGEWIAARAADGSSSSGRWSFLPSLGSRWYPTLPLSDSRCPEGNSETVESPVAGGKGEDRSPTPNWDRPTVAAGETAREQGEGLVAEIEVVERDDRQSPPFHSGNPLLGRWDPSRPVLRLPFTSNGSTSLAGIYRRVSAAAEEEAVPPGTYLLVVVRK